MLAMVPLQQVFYLLVIYSLLVSPIRYPPCPVYAEFTHSPWTRVREKFYIISSHLGLPASDLMPGTQSQASWWAREPASRGPPDIL